MKCLGWVLQDDYEVICQSMCGSFHIGEEGVEGQHILLAISLCSPFPHSSLHLMPQRSSKLKKEREENQYSEPHLESSIVDCCLWSPSLQVQFLAKNWLCRQASEAPYLFCWRNVPAKCVQLFWNRVPRQASANQKPCLGEFVMEPETISSPWDPREASESKRNSQVDEVAKNLSMRLGTGWAVGPMWFRHCDLGNICV